MKGKDKEGRIERIDLEEALENPSILFLEKEEPEIATCYRVTVERLKVSFVISEGYAKRIGEAIKAVDSKADVDGLTQLFLLLQAKMLASLGATTSNE